MRCGLGSIPLYSLKILPLFLQSTTFRSLVKPNGSNIRLRQHLGCRPFWLARRCHLQTFESPKGTRSHKWPVGTMAISISCSQPSLQFIILEKRDHLVLLTSGGSQVQWEKSRRKWVKKGEGNSASREEAESVVCERTRRRQEKAKAAKVFKYKIKCVCCALVGFYFSISSLLLIGAFQREVVSFQIPCRLLIFSSNQYS